MLYIAGVPGGAGERSRALLQEAGIDLLVVEPAGHWPFLDQPEPVVESLLELATRTRT